MDNLLQHSSQHSDHLSLTKRMENFI